MFIQLTRNNDVMYINVNQIAFFKNSILRIDGHDILVKETDEEIYQKICSLIYKYPIYKHVMDNYPIDNSGKITDKIIFTPNES